MAVPVVKWGSIILPQQIAKSLLENQKFELFQTEDGFVLKKIEDDIEIIEDESGISLKSKKWIPLNEFISAIEDYGWQDY